LIDKTKEIKVFNKEYQSGKKIIFTSPNPKSLNGELVNEIYIAFMGFDFLTKIVLVIKT